MLKAITQCHTMALHAANEEDSLSRSDSTQSDDLFDNIELAKSAMIWHKYPCLEYKRVVKENTIWASRVKKSCLLRIDASIARELIPPVK